MSKKEPRSTEETRMDVCLDCMDHNKKTKIDGKAIMCSTCPVHRLNEKLKKR